jgi:hypothetical protein
MFCDGSREKGVVVRTSGFTVWDPETGSEESGTWYPDAKSLITVFDEYDACDAVGEGDLLVLVHVLNDRPVHDAYRFYRDLRLIWFGE